MGNICFAVGSWLAMTAGAAAQATFAPIFGNPVQVWGMSPDGDALVGTGNLGGGTEGWCWVRGVGLRRMPDFAPLAVSAGGVVLGGVRGTGAYLRREGVLTQLPSGGGITPYYVHGLSWDGTVAVGEGAWGAPGAYRATLESTQNLGALPGNDPMIARGVSADGSVVVGSGGSGRAFRWTQATGLEDLGVLPGYLSSEATAVSGDGTTIVGCCTSVAGAWRAFRWTREEGMSDLGGLNGPTSCATGVSGDGSVIVGHNQAGEPFVWTSPGGMRSLRALFAAAGVNLSVFVMRDRTWVSSDGTKFGGSGTSLPSTGAAWAGTLPAVVLCYANCDASYAEPAVNVRDYICFLNKYAAGDSYANCDGSTTPPVLGVNDFICFQQRYAAGCP